MSDTSMYDAIVYQEQLATEYRRQEAADLEKEYWRLRMLKEGLNVAPTATPAQPDLPSHRQRVEYAFDLVRRALTVTILSLQEMEAVVQRGITGEFDAGILQADLTETKRRAAAGTSGPKGEA